MAAAEPRKSGADPHLLAQVLTDPAIFWFQRFQLRPGVETPGSHDIKATMDAAGVPEDMSGLSVLDVGTCNGGAAFIAEQRGASTVVAVDIHEPTIFGFRQLAEALGSSVEFRRSTVYELPRIVGREFDVVFFFAVLYHLRHPLLAIDALRQVTGDHLYFETAVNDAESGTDFYPGAYAGDSSNWFIPSRQCVLDWFKSSGFDVALTDTWSADGAQRATFAGRPEREFPDWQRASYELPLEVHADWNAAGGNAYWPKGRS
jgi:tRNA (mo5U34)-methyltransferase